MRNSIGQDSYDAMVARIGKEEADRQVRQYGWTIIPTEGALSAIPASQVSNLLGEEFMGGGDQMEDDDLADEGVASSAPSDDDLVNAYSSLGPLTAIDLTDPKQISRAILANAAQQKKYYDDLATEIKQRRYGPSTSEKLFALSAAFAAPTDVRGFSGTMSNVLPVLQKFGELRRTGEQERTEALQNLAKQRMALAQGDIKTAIDLQRLMATYNKPKQIKSVIVEDGVSYEPDTGEKIVQPNEAAWAALKSSPTQETLDEFVRTFGPRFKEKAERLIGYARGGK